jgi:hypothetical protein
MRARIATPPRQHVALRLGDQNQEGIAFASLEGAEALHAIEGRLKIAHTRKRPGAHGPEERPVRHVAPDAAFVLGRARHQNAVARQQRDATVHADVELTVELGEVACIDGRHRDSAE